MGLEKYESKQQQILKPASRIFPLISLCHSYTLFDIKHFVTLGLQMYYIFDD